MLKITAGSELFNESKDKQLLTKGAPKEKGAHSTL